MASCEDVHLQFYHKWVSNINRNGQLHRKVPIPSKGGSQICRNASPKKSIARPERIRELYEPKITAANVCQDSAFVSCYTGARRFCLNSFISSHNTLHVVLVYAVLQPQGRHLHNRYHSWLPEHPSRQTSSVPYQVS